MYPARPVSPDTPTALLTTTHLILDSIVEMPSVRIGKFPRLTCTLLFLLNHATAWDGIVRFPLLYPSLQSDNDI
jgi:hypothetical protein